MSEAYAPLEKIYPELATASERELKHDRDIGQFRLQYLRQVEIDQPGVQNILDDPTTVD